MKIRNGFVSNSSSSSFIVLFEKKPETVEELKEMMFKNWSFDDKITDDYDSRDGLYIKDIVERVYDDISCKKNNKSILDVLLSGYIDGIDNDFLVEGLREAMFKANSAKFKYYHDFSKKYGDDENSWAVDKDFLKYKKLCKESDLADDKYRKTRNKEVLKYYKNFKKKYKYHKYEHSFEYGDRNGEYVMEHCDIFRNVPHITISNH